MMIRRLCLGFCLLLLRGYQVVISPFKTPCCRFQPTCSSYARQAFLSPGVRKGAILTLKRILRCHPWGGFGYDPVPQPIKNKGNKDDET